MWRLVFLLLFLIVNAVHGFTVFEPSIECTVIKVHSTVNFLGQTKFPKLYQSINNDPLKSNLVIAGKKLPLVNPETIMKADDFEKISILIDTNRFELHLSGKPISRNGTLKVDGKLLAEVTCH